jgi:hypothetical protein
MVSKAGIEPTARTFSVVRVTGSLAESMSSNDDLLFGTKRNLIMDPPKSRV